MRNTDADWREWGEKDPYFGVLTEPKYRSQQIEQSRDDFFASGEETIRDMLATYERFLGPITRERALDFGCGVGRLTRALSARFDSVLGVDISDAMLAEATANVPDAVFALSDDQLSRAVGQFDLVLSYIVIQHIPPERGLHIIERLLEKSNSAAIIHMSIGRPREPQKSTSSAVADFIRAYVPGGKLLMNAYHGHTAHSDLPHHLLEDDPVLVMHEYHVASVMDIFRRNDFAEIIMVPKSHGGEETVTIMARRDGNHRID